MSTEAEIATFLAKYSPEISAQLRSARAKLQALFPRGCELVYDNYNALVFCFSATDRASDAILSLAGYPKWITLFFAKGRTLPDPNGLLQGSGTIIRSIRLGTPADLDRPEVLALITQAIHLQLPSLESAPPLRTILKSISSKQRPRRPPPSTQKTAGSQVEKTRK
jgi:hypothetical protein